MMEFCPKCKKLLVPEEKGNEIVLKCQACGFEKSATGGYSQKVEQEKTEDVVMLGEQKELLPEMDALCPKCENTKAYWWTAQTRAADEPMTRFYRCTKCRHTWREYG